MAAIAKKTNGVAHTVGIAGLSFVLQANSPNFASMFIVLDSFEKRRHPWRPDTAIMADLRREWAKQIKDATVTVYGASPIPGVGVAGGFKVMIEDRGDLGLPTLQKQTDDLVRKLPGGVPGLEQRDDAVPLEHAAVVPRGRSRQTASLGVSLQDVNQTIDIFLGSLYVNSFNDFGRHWQVTLQAEGAFRNSKSDVNLFQVRNNRGQMVPVGTLVNLKEIGGPISVTRYNLYTASSITGNLQPGFSSGEAIAEVDRGRQQLVAHQHAGRLDRADVHAKAGGQHFDVRVCAGRDVRVSGPGGAV